MKITKKTETDIFMVQSIEPRFNNPLRKEIRATKHNLDLSECLFFVKFSIKSWGENKQILLRSIWSRRGFNCGFICGLFPRFLEVYGAVTVILMKVLLLKFGSYLVTCFD